MVDMYTSIFGLCCLLTAGLWHYTTNVDGDKPTSTATTTNTKSPDFITFQRTWLAVYLLAMFSDWLQGPYAYALYSSLGFDSAQIALLSLIGFGSSMVVGTMVGSITDSYGRKKMTLVFVLLYSLSALTKLSADFYVLAFGRILSGIATSLLFSVFEAWMICAHNKRGFDPALISDTFSKATAGNGLCAVVAGLLADQLSAFWGFSAPFVFAIVPLVILGVVVQLHWDENTGADSSTDTKPAKDAKDAQESRLNKVLTIFKEQPHIMCLGLAQSLFEGAMYSFVFLWSPSLANVSAYTKDGESLPFGRIFATFMVIISFGSYLFGYMARKSNVIFVPFVIHSCAAVAMLLAAFLNNVNEYMMLTFFLLFEMSCGMFWPAYGTLRSQHIPEELRATVATAFRIPLNLFVVILLFQSSNLSTFTMFLVCAAAHLGSLACYWVFYNAVKKQEAAAASGAVKND